MRSLEVLGAGGGEVTGSQFLATSRLGKEYLVDLGMTQGSGKRHHHDTQLDLNSEKLQAVFITHAHIDHSGLMPLIAKEDSPNVPILMTPATYDIARIALNNSDKLSPGLYPDGGVNRILNRVVTVPYDKATKVDGITATFRDAGHILGSASIELEEGGEKIVFSGDLGNSPSRILRPRTPIKEADLVVMESTYGDRNHPENDPIDVILEAVNTIKKSKGTLLIPAFAIDRTQILLNIFKNLKREGKLGNIPVFLDSPMGIEVTDIYRKHPQWLNEELRAEKKPFNFPDLNETYSVRESAAIGKRRGAKIIIAGSGMMSGGRINKHATEYLPDKKTVILFVGFPAYGTPSRMITEGEKTVLINGESIDVNATVLQTSLSAHADQQQLIEWLDFIKKGQRITREVVLVHGNNSSREVLGQRINSELNIKVSIPDHGEKILFTDNN